MKRQTPDRAEQPSAGVASGPVAPKGDVKLDAVSKTYTRGTHQVQALTDVSVHIHSGEFVVLLGPSGSGKTTMLNLVGAIEPVTTGSIEVGGVDVSSLSGADLTSYRRRMVGFVFQFFNLVPTLTAAENVEVIAELTASNPGDHARAALAEVGLADRADHFPAELSGGEQQRVAIARALVKAAPVLLADEPTGSLDLDTGREILGLLRRTADSGRTVLLVTHNSSIAEIADRVIHLRDGRLAGDRWITKPLPVDEVTW